MVKRIAIWLIILLLIGYAAIVIFKVIKHIEAKGDIDKEEIVCYLLGGEGESLQKYSVKSLYACPSSFLSVFFEVNDTIENLMRGRVGSINQPDQTCHNDGGYCIYDNIPREVKYTDPSEDIPEKYIHNQPRQRNEIMVRDDSPNRLGEVFSSDYDSYICRNTQQKPVVIKYFYLLCKDGLFGCGYTRTAVVCGNKYFIDQYLDHTGPVLYGPFEL